MQSFFREPEVEEAVHNLILQNRCGNRLTLLIQDDHTDLEFVYKPNAYRRKEYRARNFSSRDNFTTLFAAAYAHELRAPYIKEFNYDPFVTRLTTLAPSGAKNAITIVNIADENCFAIAARCPLVLAFKPKREFEVSDGLLMEHFVDRGEEIVSFIAFLGMEENRYRVLDDGTHVLQLVENDVVLIGGEENRYQVSRAVKALRGIDLESLIARNESRASGVLARAALKVADESMQRVLDLNKRFTYASIDEGGACFGAVNRIYHLIWTRDGSMSTSQYALAGLPEPLKLWAPFLLANPAKIQQDGRTIIAWQQLFGTRWTKAEADGLFYATWTLFTYLETTGDDTLVSTSAFELLLEGLEDAISTGFDTKLGLFASDTRGESTLASSPYYGYDIVNGKMDTHRVGTTAGEGKVISRCVSCYNNILQYNVLRMIDILLQQRPDLRARFARDYAAMARDLGARIDSFFLDKDGQYRSELLMYSDGSEAYPDWMNIDYWEYAWSLALAPFHPNIAKAVQSARAYIKIWPECRSYGFSPWNALAALIREYGTPGGEIRQMLDTEIREALMLTKKYPAAGLFTEYAGATEGWRGLPFGASSFALAITGMLLKSLPQGLAIRASEQVDEVADFTWKIYRISAKATGQGEHVGSATVNGRDLPGTLQIPQSLLRPGRNTVQVTRTATPTTQSRLYSSTLMLLDARSQAGRTLLEFAGCSMGELVIENATTSVTFKTPSGQQLHPEGTLVPGTHLTVYPVSGITEGLTVEL
jgi:hypothetical protein